MSDPLKRKTRRRRWRWAALLAALLATGYFILTSSWALKGLVLARAGAALGASVTADTVEWTKGHLIISHPTVRAPGIAGDGGVIFDAKLLDASISLSKLFKGEMPLSQLIAIDPVLRISQSIDDGSINLAALAILTDPRNTSPPATPISIPDITIRGGGIELGEHATNPARHPNQPLYSMLRRIGVEGKVERTQDGEESVISFKQVQAPAVPSPGGFVLEGRVSRKAVTLKMSDLQLQDITPESMPSSIRDPIRRLGMKGAIRDVSITYSFDGGATARFSLSDVAINLPLEQQAQLSNGHYVPISPSLGAKVLRMEHVRGDLAVTDRGGSGNISGVVGDLDYHAEFSVSGVDENAPFSCWISCRNYQLSSDPPFALFVPRLVRKRLEQFGHPTGLLDADVFVARTHPGADVNVWGDISLVSGSAAFDRFPYRFEDLSLHAVFDADALVIEDITASAPGGVKLAATATIAPPNDEAQLLVQVHVSDIPVDNRLRGALDAAKSGDVANQLFHIPSYERLLEAGLVISPAQAVQLKEQARALEARAALTPEEQAALARIRSRLAAPVFEPGGKADIDVAVYTPQGKCTDYGERIAIHFDEVSVLIKAFPYPMVGHNVDIVKNDEIASVEGVQARGLTGAAATISASIDTNQLVRHEAHYAPEVEVTAHAVPPDELAFFAMPSHEELSGGESIAQLLRRLHLSGAADAVASVGMKRSESGERLPWWIARVGLQGLAAQPGISEPGGELLSNLDGAVVADPEQISVTLGAGVGRSKAPPSEAQAHAIVGYGPRSRDAQGHSSIAFSSRIESLALDTPLEDIVAVFSSEAGKKLEEVRAKLRPTGVADVQVQVQRSPGTPLEAAAAFERMRDAALDYSGERLVINSTGGTLRVLAMHDSERLSFESLAARVSDSSGASGLVRMSGVTDTLMRPLESGLKLDLQGARFESRSLHAALIANGKTRLADWLKSHAAAGEFDLSSTLAPAPSGLDFRATLTPRSINVLMDSVPVAVTFPRAQIEIQNSDGRLQDVQLQSGAWSATLNGGWFGAADGSLSADTRIDLAASSLTPDLRALLPEGARSALDVVQASVTSALTARVDDLSVSWTPDGEVNVFSTDASIDVHGLSLDCGVLVTDCSALIDLHAARSAASAPVTFELDVSASKLLAAGVEVSDAKARIVEDGSLRLPTFEGNCHGGRVSGSATLKHALPASTFDVSVKGSNIRFASVLADLGKTNASIGGPGTPDDSRGLLDFGVSLAGRVGEPATRRGTGLATISGGRVFTVPLVVGLVRASNLQLPLDEALDFAKADFVVSGSRIDFREAIVSSESVDIYGFGTTSWPDLQLDLRLGTKARNRIPLVSTVMERLRNELITATVKGTPAKPEINIQSFGGTTRLVKGMLGHDLSEQERRLEQIEKTSEKDPLRFRGRGARD